MIKNIYRSLALCCTIPLLVSCSDKRIVHVQSEQTHITLSWWGNDSRNEYTLSAIEIFEKLHPDIKVDCSYSEWSGYETRNRVRMISETETDVMQINFSWLSDYSADGTGYYDIELLSDYVALDNFSDDMLEYGRKNGVLNAIPIAMNTQTVYINKSIFDSYNLDIPQSCDDFFNAAEVMSKDGIYPLSGVARSVWFFCIAYAEQVTGKSIIDDSENLNFSPEEFQIMIDLYVDMVDKKVIPQVENYQKFNLDNGTFAGALAWVSDAINYFGTAIDNGFDIDIADYTAVSPDLSGIGWYAKPATLYAVSKNTDHPKESAILLDFLLNSPEMAELQGVEKGVPLSKSAKDTLQEKGILTGLQYEAALKMESCDSLAKMLPILEDSNITNYFIDACNLVIYDKTSSEEASVTLYEQILSQLSTT